MVRKATAIDVPAIQRLVNFFAQKGDLLPRTLQDLYARVRDFHGVALSGFDGSGNYTLGIKEQIVFPEIDYSKIDKIRGMEISIVTTAGNNEEAMTLFKEFGMPFQK